MPLAPGVRFVLLHDHGKGRVDAFDLAFLDDLLAIFRQSMLAYVRGAMRMFGFGYTGHFDKLGGVLSPRNKVLRL